MERFFLILERNQKEESFRDYVEWKRKFSTQIYNVLSRKKKLKNIELGFLTKTNFMDIFTKLLSHELITYYDLQRKKQRCKHSVPRVRLVR